MVFFFFVFGLILFLYPLLKMHEVVLEAFQALEPITSVLEPDFAYNATPLSYIKKPA